MLVQQEQKKIGKPKGGGQKFTKEDAKKEYQQMSDADQTNGISTKCQCGFKGGETPDCKGKGEEGKPPEMPQIPKPEDKPSQPQNQQPCAATGAEASFLGASTTATTTATSTKPCLRSDGSSGALSTAFGDSLGSTFGSVSSAVRSAGSSAFDFISLFLK